MVAMELRRVRINDLVKRSYGMRNDHLLVEDPNIYVHQRYRIVVSNVHRSTNSSRMIIQQTVSGRLSQDEYVGFRRPGAG